MRLFNKFNFALHFATLSYKYIMFLLDFSAW